MTGKRLCIVVDDIEYPDRAKSVKGVLEDLYPDDDVIRISKYTQSNYSCNGKGIPAASAHKFISALIESDNINNVVCVTNVLGLKDGFHALVQRLCTTHDILSTQIVISCKFAPFLRTACSEAGVDPHRIFYIPNPISSHPARKLKRFLQHLENVNTLA